MTFWKPSPLALAIAKSLKDKRDEWKLNEYTLVHDSKVRIWVANQDWGVKVNKIKPSGPSRRCIFKAYQQCLADDILAAGEGHES